METDIWIDGHAKGLPLLVEFKNLRSLQFYRLAKKNVPTLAALQLPHLKELLIRLGSLTDLVCIAQLISLKRLTIFQCSKINSLEGLDSLSNLRILALIDIGKVNSLEPLSGLIHLDELIINGGVFSKQAMPSLQPIAQLGRKFKILDLSGVKTELADLTPLARLPESDEFGISVRFFPLEQVALLVAAYPNWGVRLMKL